MQQALLGTLALVGAGEYLPKVEGLDRFLLGQTPTPARVVVLPTAAVPDGSTVTERWASMGVEHFSKLGAQVEPVMLLTRADAEDERIVNKLAAANFVYFSGGKPRYLLETLQGTRAWEVIKQIFQGGGIVAGCSAGAMVMGGALFDFPQVWRTRPALGLAPNIVVIPHFDELPTIFADNATRAAEKHIVAGIDGGTALIGSHNGWLVQGVGGVTIFHGKNKMRYSAGEAVPLEPLRA